MSAVPVGSFVTYQCKAATGEFTSIGDIESRVASDLQLAGLAVVDYQVDTGSFLSSIGGQLGFNEPFGLTLHLLTSVGYAAEDDLKSIVDHYIQQETGNPPGSSSIPYVQAPGAANTPTDQPVQSATGAAPPAPALSFGDSIVAFFKGLTSSGGMVFGLVGLGVIVALVLITSAGGAARRAV